MSTKQKLRVAVSDSKSPTNRRVVGKDNEKSQPPLRPKSPPSPYSIPMIFKDPSKAKKYKKSKATAKPNLEQPERIKAANGGPASSGSLDLPNVSTNSANSRPNSQSRNGAQSPAKWRDSKDAIPSSNSTIESQNTGIDGENVTASSAEVVDTSLWSEAEINNLSTESLVSISSASRKKMPISEVIARHAIRRGREAYSASEKFRHRKLTPIEKRLLSSPFARVAIITSADEKLMKLYEMAKHEQINSKPGSGNIGSAGAHRIRMGIA